ncbi:hypothetical protein Btru_069644 [Bulinus truncatus]|nr:hypothetical protein Btru_069644 [Bulinus truncatus]
MLRGVLLAAVLTGAGDTTNMFFRKVNSIPWNNNAYGLLIYNVSEFRPTCNWKIIVTSSYPICFVKSIAILPSTPGQLILKQAIRPPPNQQRLQGSSGLKSVT